MTISSRQNELIEHLRRAGDFVPVAELAEIFGVTVRTVLRDADVLRGQGHVLTGARGRGGGLKLEGDANDASSPSTGRRAGGRGATRARDSQALNRSIFVGREAELDSLHSAVSEARRGLGRVVMLTGEPGIGKTTIARRLADAQAEQDVQVLWGRCNEAEGSPAYWPWIQMVRAHASRLSPKQLKEQMGDGAADIGEVVPDLFTLIPELERPAKSNWPESDRFRLFEAFRAFFVNAAGQSPLILFMEDLHRADEPSLMLFEFLAQELIETATLFVGTYRDVELNRQHPLANVLGELNRLPRFERISLRGLEHREVKAYMDTAAGGTAPPGLVDTVHNRTEGNPLFITETVRLLAQQGHLDGTDNGIEPNPELDRIPEGIREAIGRRLDTLSPASNLLISYASVLGRDFTIQELQHLTTNAGELDGFGNDDDSNLLVLLEEAIQSRIIERDLAQFARFQFTHGLIREALYEELTTPQRARLHQLAGETLEELYYPEVEPHLPQLAHHFLEAAQGGEGAAKAVDFAHRAGTHAVGMVAFEEGIRLFRMALQATQLATRPDSRKRAELLIALGESQRLAGNLPDAMATHNSAYELARRVDAVDLMAEAAIAFEQVIWRPGIAGTRAAPLLREAMEAQEPGDGIVKARLMASLGRSLNYVGSFEEALATGDDAIAMARRLGDPETLATALWSRLPTRWNPADIHNRIELGYEAARICELQGLQNKRVEAETWLLNDLFEIGDVEAIETAWKSWTALALRVRDPMWLYSMIGHQMQVAALKGEFTEAERLAQDGLELGRRMPGLDSMGVFGVQMFSIRRDQGRLHEVRPMIEGIVKARPNATWRPGLAVLYVELDMNDEAREAFEQLAENDFEDVGEDALYAATLVYLAEICAYLKDSERAKIIYEMLLPRDNRNITFGVGNICVGSSSRYLGMLAALLERWDDAERHFADALELNHTMGSLPQMAYTNFDYAVMLRSRNGYGDAKRSKALLADTVEDARRLGMAALVKRATDLLESGDAERAARPVYPAGLSAREVEVIRLIALGRANREIATELFITTNTVANHVKNILNKTGATNRTEAAAFAVREGLI